MKKQPIESTVHPQELTVDYWRERFKKVFERFGTSVTKLASELGERDEDFAGVIGYRRLDNMSRHKASLCLTAKAVRLMEKLRPDKKPRTTLLSRQKINTL